MRASPGDERYLYCRGVAMPTPFPVRTWDQHGMRWTGRIRLVTRAVMCHWSGAENPPASMFENMSTRRNPKTGAPEPLSVHFGVDHLGTVFQFADTEMRCSHCNAPKNASANGWSIGIEFQGRGHAAKVPTRGVTRSRAIATIHGDRVAYSELTERQVYVGVLLVEFLCGLYGLPLAVPTDLDGEVVLNVLPESTLARYRGVLGHLHTEPKYDPGRGLLEAIRDRAKDDERS